VLRSVQNIQECLHIVKSVEEFYGNFHFVKDCGNMLWNDFIVSKNTENTMVVFTESKKVKKCCKFLLYLICSVRNRHGMFSLSLRV
jgi:hypothetical protein